MYRQCHLVYSIFFKHYSGINLSNCHGGDGGDLEDEGGATGADSSPLNGMLLMDDQMLGETDGGDTDGGGGQSPPSRGGDGTDGEEGSVTGSGGNSNGKRKVPKVFPKEAITKFRTWLFNNLTVRITVFWCLGAY